MSLTRPQETEAQLLPEPDRFVTPLPLKLP
jgi:hypothetical protein